MAALARLVRTAMALEMKPRCEKCGLALAQHSEAYICSYECTFCPDCTRSLASVCPNCGGELVRRPKRKPVEVTQPA
jgi:hypothetical protein